MIRPYGSDYLKPLFVSDPVQRSELLAEGEYLPSLLLNPAAAANAVMLGSGYFNPLSGYMNLADAMSCSEKICTTDDLVWPIPILNCCNDISEIKNARRIALRDPNVKLHPIIAIMELDNIEPVTTEQLAFMAESIFLTLDQHHPGVSTFLELGSYLVSGSLQVLGFSYYKSMFPSTFQTADEIRAQIMLLGWDKIVAFQTRNPMHLAHEELCRMAMERVDADGVIVHMLLGKLKQGDIPGEVRDKCIRTIADRYFPRDRMMVSGYGFDMLYAGPREAVLHAIARQNMGATHLIVGRDHAGVGTYYEPFAAQHIFSSESIKGALGIQIFCADHVAFSKKLGSVVMVNEVLEHNKDDFFTISGTKLREMLAAGINPPEEICRREVAEILIQHYQK